MRPRAVGGYEPDERDQAELVELWHLSRTALAGKRTLSGAYADSVRSCRLTWCINTFITKHQGEPHVFHKWIYVWAEANLGQLVQPSSPPRVSRRGVARKR